jgi:DNA-binding transcriptional MerR regulator
MSTPTVHTDAARGYRGPEACGLAGISYRQLDYWTRTALVEATVRPASGSGTQRLYSRADVVKLAAAAELVRAGLSLVAVRELLASFDIDSDEHLIHHTGYVAVVVNLSKLKERIEEPPLVPDQPTAPSLSIVQ